MTSYKFKKLIEEKKKFMKKIYPNETSFNEYDLIKEEFMIGRHKKLTDRQLNKILDNCIKKGHGAVCLRNS